MGFFDKYPYSNFHEMNLDWLIAKMKELEIDFDEFKVVNHITFSGQWDITKQYPAWTIVSDNNIGYVSIQPVPVGITLNNTDYWVEVIDYTAQIAGLQQRVVDIENDIDNNIKPDITSLQNDVSTLNTDVSILKNRQFLFIGDSYAEGDYYWKSYTQKGWCYYVADYLNLGNHAHYAVHGGSGFVGVPNTKTFGEVAAEYAGDKDVITDIVICGGYNDKNKPGLYSAMVSQIGDIKTLYPNAIIWIGFIGWNVSMYDDGLRVAASVYNDTAVSLGCNIFKNSQLVLHNYNVGASAYFDRDYPEDLYHPNDNGEQAIAKYIAAGLNYSEYMPPLSGVSKIGNSNFITALVDASYPDILRCNCPTVEINLTPVSTTFDGNRSLALGTISEGLIIGAYDTAFNAHVVIWGTSRFYECVARCKIDSGNITLTAAILNSAGTAWVTDNVQQVRFLSSTFNLARVYC